jgi:hypothetical protein
VPVILGKRPRRAENLEADTSIAPRGDSVEGSRPVSRLAVVEWVDLPLGGALGSNCLSRGRPNVEASRPAKGSRPWLGVADRTWVIPWGDRELRTAVRVGGVHSLLIKRVMSR